MNVNDAIKNRRSNGKVSDAPVEREVIEQLLAAATQAPNHYHTEPWKFYVLQGEGRRALGKTIAEIAKEELDNPTSAHNQALLMKQEQKAFRAPLIITVVASVDHTNPKVYEVEEVAAVSAGVQNMLLTAHALGLGAIWRTGAPAYHPKMKRLFGLGQHETIIGFIYVGYPQEQPPQKKRPSFEHKTVWIDDALEWGAK